MPPVSRSVTFENGSAPWSLEVWWTTMMKAGRINSLRGTPHSSQKLHKRRTSRASRKSFPLFGSVEDEVVACFRNGGGVPYSSYKRFPEVMRELSAPTFDTLLVDKILPLVPGLVDRLRRGIEVLDVGSGSGRAVNVMARAFPNSRFAG